eukprot:ctg_588.g261
MLSGKPIDHSATPARTRSGGGLPCTGSPREPEKGASRARNREDMAGTGRRQCRGHGAQPAGSGWLHPVPAAAAAVGRASSCTSLVALARGRVGERRPRSAASAVQVRRGRVAVSQRRREAQGDSQGGGSAGDARGGRSGGRGGGQAGHVARVERRGAHHVFVAGGAGIFGARRDLGRAIRTAALVATAARRHARKKLETIARKQSKAEEKRLKREQEKAEKRPAAEGDSASSADSEDDDDEEEEEEEETENGKEEDARDCRAS